MKHLLIVLLVILFKLCDCRFPNGYGQLQEEKIEDDPGKPLILTPLIEQNKIKEAQTAAKVNFNGFKNVASYSGYFTVNKQYNSNLFFWFFPAQTNYTTAPVVVWLQGGPGASSLIGLFSENGPFSVKSKHGLKLRKYSWTETNSVIYIDNPVGTGFSFTDDGGFAQNQTKVGEDLYTALQQFFLLFPELQKNPFFVTGESYGGKYVPALSYTIYKKNPEAKLKINLQGLSIGNGFSDPVNQLNYADYLYQIGLIDAPTQKMFTYYQNQGIDYIKKGDYNSAFKLFDNLLDGDLTNKSSLFKNITGFTNYFNYLYPLDLSNELVYMAKYLQRSDVRSAIHVGNTPYIDVNQTVEKNLQLDIMQSVAPWISELLSNYRVLIYNGQLDIIVAYPLTLNFLGNLKFSGSDDYAKAGRFKWFVGDDLAGYVKQGGNLTEVLVRDAGHMVPTDQPQWAFDLINRFISNKPFHQ